MSGSKTEYIIQHRVQDYWLDYAGDTVGGVYWYLDRAQEGLARLRDDKPKTDFRLIKRVHRFTDETL